MQFPVQVFTFLFVLYSSVLAPVAIAQDQSVTTADSLRKEINTTEGADKISLQLDLAIEISGNDRIEAQTLSRDALDYAKKEANSFLEMKSYYTLGRTFLSFEDIDIAQSYYDSALVIAEEIDNNWYKGEILFRQGTNQHRKTEDFQALEYFNNAIEASSLAENYKIMGSSYSMMGTIFRVNGLYDRAIEYIIKSRFYYEKADFSEGSAWVSYLLGRIYSDMGLYDRAMRYFQESLEIYQELFAIDNNANGVAICNEQIGLINLEKENYARARQNIKYTLELHTESGSKYGISNAYKHLGRIDYYTGNYDKALEELQKALSIKNEINDYLSKPAIYQYIGMCRIKTGEIKTGLSYLEQGLDIAVSNNQQKIQLDIYASLADIYLYLEMPSKAIPYLNKQIEIQNQSLTGAANVKFEQLQSIYEIEEKNSRIDELQRQNEISALQIRQQRRLQVIMIIGIISILVFTLIIYLLYRKLRQKNLVLNEINITRDKLYSIIAHDLKGPLGSALGLSELLVEDSGIVEDSNYREHVAVIYSSLNQTNDLLNNLLVWTRSQLSRIEFHPRPVNLSKLVDDSIDFLSLQATNKNIDIINNIDSSFRVNADEEMLKTITRNLLSNAIKFSHDGGRVTIDAKHDNTHTEVSVKDEGTGIPAEKINELFKLESDSSTTGTSGEKGTGLGLILVKEFVEKHGGDIDVISEPGKGSNFIFKI